MFSSEQLLNPVPGEQPCGTSLSFSSEFDDIAEARRFDDRSIDQGEWITEHKDANWSHVVERCCSLLEHRSKDVRLAVWLTEAAAKQHGIAGLAEGLRVLSGLIEEYWHMGLHPDAPDDDHEQRIDNLSWILVRAPILLGEMPVTTGSARSYTLNDVDAASRHPEGPDLKLADVKLALAANPGAFTSARAAEAQSCLDVLAQLEAAADERLGANRPGFAATRERLKAILHLMRPAAPAGARDDIQAKAQGNDCGAPHASARTRAEAIAQLRSVAEFFRRTEPHSPVSYFADKAASAGEQSLHDWLRSVVKDPASLAHIEELLGVPPRQT